MPAPPATPEGSLAFLAGGGEAGALMRATDWTHSPLGAPETWPRNLRAVVQIMLASRFAMRIIWGPEFIFLYNDAYRPILGEQKHPTAMGSRTAESFREVWDVVGPMFRRVLDGESFALDDYPLPLERNGYLEECYFTLSYSPVHDDEDGIGGVLGVVHETTDRVLAARRLRTLRDLAAGAALARTPELACTTAAEALARDSADVPFALFYLTEPDGRSARLVAGPNDDHAVPAPAIVRIDRAEASAWPLHLAATERRLHLVEDLAERFGELHAGPFPEPVRGAVVLPLARPGTATPFGFLVAGINPRQRLDDAYRGFFDLAIEHIATAITNAISLTEERNLANQLRATNQELDQFAYIASHDLKAPLRGIANLSEWIEEALADKMEDETRRHMNLLRGRVHRLEALIDGILSYSRASRVQAAREPVDLGALFREVRDLLAPPETATFHVGPMPTILAERVPLQQVFLNLVGNALKHGKGANDAVLVEISAIDRGATVEIVVRDHGPGIAPKYHERIWGIFQRLEARDKVEGTGIGLSVVKKIVESRGGRVSVDSEEGAGAAFHVVWPKSA